MWSLNNVIYTYKYINKYLNIRMHNSFCLMFTVCRYIKQSDKVETHSSDQRIVQKLLKFQTYLPVSFNFITLKCNE